MTTNNSTIAKTVTNVTLEGITTFVSGFVPSGAAGTVNAGDTQISGVRDNLAFESLTIFPNQQTLYARRRR
ncbi:esterase-like activity of phytase family protein [Nostoc sp. CMAA1605]|uniref:esterase-like activity of phytase family protein n=1 Tax=Nostoc sp. CMAA1605 TaxID=2055159 RepID=UPI001F1DA804|nr:esterase-like activity of phytase family protein [Nostoc sp. CMAA1605]MCF4968547.1 hypothetical protein [Nostoc sp. CMAA1605]